MSTAIETDVGQSGAIHERCVVTDGDTLPVPSFRRDTQAPTPNQPPRIGVAAFVERTDRVLQERPSVPLAELREIEAGHARTPLIEAYPSKTVRPVVP